MELADILSEESVLFCTDIKTKRDVLERLSTQAAKAAAPLMYASTNSGWALMTLPA